MRSGGIDTASEVRFLRKMKRRMEREGVYILESGLRDSRAWCLVFGWEKLLFGWDVELLFECSKCWWMWSSLVGCSIELLIVMMIEHAKRVLLYLNSFLILFHYVTLRSSAVCMMRSMGSRGHGKHTHKSRQRLTCLTVHWCLCQS